MNLHVPREHRLWFRPFDGHVTLYENVENTVKTKLSHMVITIGEDHYFAPWIYEFYQRSARMLIYKERPSVTTEESEKIYLVHRSFPNRELQHPGGHLEYIESCYRSDSSSGYYLTYHTGYDYVRLLLPHLLQGKSYEDFTISADDITPSMDDWYRSGASREVLEESGLDLTSEISSFNLLKIGTRTFYMSLSLNSEVDEQGPLAQYAREVVDYHSITNGTLHKDLTKLDRFWLDTADPITNHAWLTASDMVEYWEPFYKTHVLELIRLLEPIFSY